MHTRLLPFLALAVGLHAGCGDNTIVVPDHLACGLPINGGATRDCTRDKEVCICAWNSCAVREDTPDGCRSGYRYVADDFAAPDVRGRCVEAELVTWRVDQGSAIKQCELLRVDAGPADATEALDAAIDASVDAVAIDAAEPTP